MYTACAARDAAIDRDETMSKQETNIRNTKIHTGNTVLLRRWERTVSRVTITHTDGVAFSGVTKNGGRVRFLFQGGYVNGAERETRDGLGWRGFEVHTSTTAVIQ